MTPCVSPEPASRGCVPTAEGCASTSCQSHELPGSYSLCLLGRHTKSPFCPMEPDPLRVDNLWDINQGLNCWHFTFMNQDTVSLPSFPGETHYGSVSRTQTVIPQPCTHELNINSEYRTTCSITYLNSLTCLHYGRYLQKDTNIFTCKDRTTLNSQTLSRYSEAWLSDRQRVKY